MKNQVKIMINDPEVLRELLKDPEVAVRVKDAVVEEAVRKVVKDGIANAVKDAAGRYLREFSHPAQENEIFGKPSCGCLVLSEYMKERIRKETKDAIIEVAFKSARSGEAEKELVEAKEIYRQELVKAAEKVERLAKEEVSRMVRCRLGKLMGES